MDVWEVVRPPWADQSIGEIARTLGYDRKTIRRYIRIAVEKGLSREALLPPRQEVLAFLGDFRWHAGPNTVLIGGLRGSACLHEHPPGAGPRHRG